VSDLAAPPASLLRSAWLPIIRIFVRRAIPLLRAGTLTSWFRTPAMNRAVGGDPDSQHLFAIAWDIIPGFPGLITDEARESGLIAVPTGSPVQFVHVQLFPAGMLARFGIRFPEG